MNALWRPADLKAALNVSRYDSVELRDIDKVVIDSRQAEEGTLFVGIQGENHNGSDFSEQALATGAELCLVDKLPTNSKAAKHCLVVPDTLEALTSMGYYRRQQASHTQIFAVTGSVGKTSTKEMLKLALTALGKTHVNVGNFNNHIGLPLTLANMPVDSDFSVLEMGMNHAGEISHLTQLGRPDIAIITNIFPVHLEFFNSVEDIARAKAEIFEGIPEGGIAVLPYDSEYFALLSSLALERQIRTVSFGKGKGADYQLLESSTHQEMTNITIHTPYGGFNYTLSAYGEHLVVNSIAVLASICAKLGKDAMTKASHALQEFQVHGGRGSVVKCGDLTIIDESYNASNASILAAVKTSVQRVKEEGRLILFLGDIRELGQSAQDIHIQLGKDLSKLEFTTVHTVGKITPFLREQIPVDKRGKMCDNVDQMLLELPFLISEGSIRKGDTIMIKGSRGIRMDKIVKWFADEYSKTKQVAE
jgi:UDP-N-acetylmuramoyl-tripeptide--D-alanyl-D-alanine ligase